MKPAWKNAAASARPMRRSEMTHRTFPFLTRACLGYVDRGVPAVFAAGWFGYLENEEGTVGVITRRHGCDIRIRRH